MAEFEEVRPHMESLAWYEAGLDHGIELGLIQAEALAGDAATYAQAAARISEGRERYSDLATKRGEAERAEAHRALMAERGIDPPPPRRVVHLLLGMGGQRGRVRALCAAYERPTLGPERSSLGGEARSLVLCERCRVIALQGEDGPA